MAVSPLEEAVEAAPSDPAAAAPVLLSKKPRGPLRYTRNAKDLGSGLDYLKLDQDHPEHLMNARWMDLNFEPSSEIAQSLVERLAKEVTLWQRANGLLKRKRSPSKEASFQRTLGAFCADLLANAFEHDGRWGYRSQSNGSFTGIGVSARQYKQVRTAFEALGYLEGIRGFSEALFDGVQQSGRADRIRASERLLGALGAEGVAPATLRQHFYQALPRDPLQLKGPSEYDAYGRKTKGPVIDFEETDQTRKLEADIRELNEFLDQFILEGGVHRGYRRIFNQGTAKGYQWDKGGRLYGQEADCYQYMKPDQRANMRLDGEPVVEIVIRASYMTILYAHYGIEMGPDEDPYVIEDVPHRKVVKDWVTITLGSPDFHSKWPKRLIEKRRKQNIDLLRDYPIEKVQSSILRRHPFLEEWPASAITWADLMFIESEAVIGTMLRLMREHQVPCFSVHDSVIVPRSQCELAKTLLTEEYKRHVGTKPRLKVSV